MFTCCISGGNWNNAANAGLFTVNVNNVPSNSNANIGARIMGSKNINSVSSLPLGKNL